MKKILFFISFICVLLLFPAVSIQAAGESVSSGKVIRVGWYEQDGYMQLDGEGNLYGYGMDYLEAIARYTGWQYEFVQGTREECIEWLENKEIDILSPVGSEESIQGAFFTNEIIDNDYGYMYKDSDNFHLNFDDFDKMNMVTVGIVKDEYLLGNLNKYCEKKGFSFKQIKIYSTIDEMRTALAEQKIDVLVTGSFVNMRDLKVIGRFSNGRAVFACSNEYIALEIDRGMEKIRLNNLRFSTDLREFYFSDGSQNHLEYTSNEREFLAEGQIFKIALGKDQFPISYTDEDGNHKGIALEVLQRLENYTGIQFEIEYVDSYKSGEQSLLSGKVDILGNGIILAQGAGRITAGQLYNSEEEGYRHTTGIHELSMLFVGEEDVNMNRFVKVAVPSYFEKSVEILKMIYPNYEYVIYASDEACIQSVIDGEMDVAVQSDLKMNELSLYDKYQDLHNLKYIPGNYAITFEVNTEDALLLGVLNKAINMISDSTMAAIVNKHIQRVTISHFSFGEIVKGYSQYFIMGFILAVFLVMGLNYYHKYREELKSKQRAYRDSVANIASMEKFRLDVSAVIEGGQKDKYYAIAVDIDKFKVINDLYGYDQGDRTILFLAKVLQMYLTSQDYISRISADNFIVIKYADNLEEVIGYLTKVFGRIDEIMQSQKTYYHLILKAGIYQLKDEDNNLSSILDKACMARDSIAHSHQSTYRMYQEDMRQQNLFTKNLENEMEDALKTGQFQIYLQPQVDFRTKKIVSAEALVRWKHPDKGMIPPGDFIPVFEKNGFVSKLDHYIWEETIRTIVRWNQENKKMVPIAINLSRIDLQNDNMVDELKELMDKYGLESHWIKAELTESVCLDSEDLVLNTMRRLKELGFQIAMDDFGSGYSSLNLLKKMPIDILKIDKSFLEFKAEMGVRDEIIIRDIVGMGKHLNLQVLIEGVESKEQSVFLESIGCDVAQGYYYGGPMPVDEFERKLVECYQGDTKNEW